MTVRHGEDESLVAQPANRELFAAAKDQDALVTSLVQARLFVSDRTADDNQPMVRLAHEALLRCWPRLVQWLDADREFLRVRARVSAAAARWSSEGRLHELLLPAGKPLVEGDFLLSQPNQELDHSVVEYIELSLQSAARIAEERRQAFLREQKQRIMLEWQLYAGTIEKVRRFFEEGSGSEARTLLNGIRGDKRGWEVNYLNALLFGHQSVIRVPHAVDVVCFLPDGRYVATGGAFLGPPRLHHGHPDRGRGDADGNPTECTP